MLARGPPYAGGRRPSRRLRRSSGASGPGFAHQPSGNQRLQGIPLPSTTVRKFIDSPAVTGGLSNSLVPTEEPNSVRLGHPDEPLALGLRPGELVRVRSASEIFATLDERGRLDGLPLMPEMLKYCGHVCSVAQRADKTCAGDGVVRRMHNTVHLGGIRCDGSAHGGCQAACLLFWKEAWLERAEDGGGLDAEDGQLTAEEESFVADTLHPPPGRGPTPKLTPPPTDARPPRYQAHRPHCG